MEIPKTTWMRETICFATEPYIFLAMFTLSSRVSVVPQLLLRKTCNGYYNESICSNLGSEEYPVQEAVVHEKAAQWNLYLFLAVSVPSIFSSGLLGYLYDAVFRAKVIVIVPVTMALQAIVYLISAKHMDLHVGYLILGSSINTFCGDIQGSILLAYAYMADITNKDQRRSLRMAITESSVFAGQAIGSLVGGFLLGHFGFESVFWASLGASILNFIYVGVVLPNPMKSMEQDKAIASSRVKDFLSNTVSKDRLRIFVPLLLAVIFTNMAVLGENEILVLYLKHQPLALPPREIGLYLGILHLGRGVGAAINAFFLTKCVKSTDYIIAMTGLASLIFTHVAISLVRSRSALYTTSILSLTVPLAMSSFRSIATKTVSEDEHGMSLSLIAVISMIGLTIVTVAANEVYRVTSYVNPGMAMLLLACFSGTALIITIVMFMRDRLFRHRQRATDSQELESEDEFIAPHETTPFLEGDAYNK